MTKETMVKRVRVIVLALLMLSVCCAFMSFTTDCYAATSKTVSTQSAFEKALKSKSIKTITVKTSKSKTITVPKGNYTTKSVVVNGSKVKFVNKGKIKNLTVKAAKSVTQKGTASKITINSKNTDVLLGKSGKTKKVRNTKPGMRLMSYEETDIEADAGADIILKAGAEDTEVDIDTSQYTSVVNYSKDNVTAEVNDEDKILKSGEVYSTGEVDETTSNPVDIDSPFTKISGIQKVKGLTLEIHGYGQFAGMTTAEGVHGWYHNNGTGTDYECRYAIDGDKVIVQHISNVNFENKYLGDAEFTIAEITDEYIELVSCNDVYGDNGTSYTLYFGDGTAKDDGTVNASNPLSIFSGLAGDYPVSMEIHGCGDYAYMSHGNSIHGWYYNSKTDTQYECVLEVEGTIVTAEKIDNPYNKNYMGDAVFEIAASDSTSVEMRSCSNIYGDEGKVYSFTADADVSRKPVDDSNPLVIFSGMVSSDILNLEIHGSGEFSDYSYGNSIHGWYHNTKTGTDYECRFKVNGSKVVADYIDNKNYNRNYLGKATFVIVGHTETSVTLKSTSNIYGDEGKTYTFKAPKKVQENTDSASTPLGIFYESVHNSELPLLIHGCGKYSYMSKGNSIHGWYKNPSTDTAYECRYVVEGNHIDVTYIKNANHEKNYLGNAEFEIVSYDSRTVTIKSLNNVYGDKGKEYVLKSDNTGVPVSSHPFVIFSGMVSAGNINLDIHGNGQFAYMTTEAGIHGWYHNLVTGTDYECRYVYDGNHIEVMNVENKNYTKNYLGDAEFEVVSRNGTQVVIRSINNIYGDEGTEYILEE